MILVETGSDHVMESAQFRPIQPAQRKVFIIDPNVSNTQSAKSSRIKQEFSSDKQAPGDPDNETIEERQKRLEKDGQSSIKSELFTEELKYEDGYAVQSESNDSSYKSNFSSSSTKELSQ
jgi:hypothetical protein